MLYARARLFIGTAPKEPFGLTPVEAMAAGAPVLAPDQGGPSETVVDGETGALYRSGDAADLARQLVGLCSNPLRLARMSVTARQHVCAHYTLGNTIASLSDALNALCGC